jgi:hypothetical protein
MLFEAWLHVFGLRQLSTNPPDSGAKLQLNYLPPCRLLAKHFVFVENLLNAQVSACSAPQHHLHTKLESTHATPAPMEYRTRTANDLARMQEWGYVNPGGYCP